MKIGIVGVGNMRRFLGWGWALTGHEVPFGASDLQTASCAAALARTQGAAQEFAVANDEGTAFGEVVLCAVRNTEGAHVLANTATLDGCVAIDANNGRIPEGWFDFTPATQSLNETLQS